MPRRKKARWLIGIGMLSWMPDEEAPQGANLGGRYGLVYLRNRGLNRDRDGMRGTLVAEVREGKWRRSAPVKKGDEIVLSNIGTLVYAEGPDRVGIMPESAGTRTWMRPKALLKVHEVMVNLYFEEDR